MLPQQYCLRWRYHHSNLQTMFSQLLEREAFCDVTLACEGQTIKAHKIVLSACSTYFETILSQYEEKDPILIMKDVKFVDIKGLVEFMYKGEINVDHCHLATLLKTAEDLRIKGLAEVSWREEGNSQENTSTVENCVFVNKRKRGRPPMDDYDSTTSSICTPNKVEASDAKVRRNEENRSTTNEDISNSDQDLSIWEEEQTVHEIQNDHENHEHEEVRVKIEPPDDLPTDDYHMQPMMMNEVKMDTSATQNEQPKMSTIISNLQKDWPDVVKMTEYLNTGRRQQFWEEPFTKRVMDAIKNKNLEMKIAAELLGVSYGTLYGRYRDAYGCLKHPYRVRDFWSEQIPTEIIAKLKRKEITLFRAAEQLNVTPQTLSNYLVTMSLMDEPHSSGNPGIDEFDSDRETSLQERPAFSNTVKKSVLPNCPDITIIKKEHFLGKINNNSDQSGQMQNE